VDACLLVVPARRQPQLNRSSTDGKLVREEETGIELLAVSSDDVDLIRAILSVNQAIAATPTSPASNEHNIALSTRPLALDPDEPRPKIENQVVALITQRLKDAHASFHRLEDDRLLGHNSFLIRRQHPHMVPAEPDGLLPVL